MDDETPEQGSSPRASARLSSKRKKEATTKKPKKRKIAEGESNDNEKALKKAPDMNELGMVMYNVLVGAVPTKRVLRMTDIALPMIFLFIMSRLHALEQSLSSVVRMHPAAPSEGDEILSEFFARKKGRPATNKKVSRPPKMVKFMTFERTDQESDNEDEETKEEAKAEAKASTAKASTTPPKNNRVSSEAEKGDGKGSDFAALTADQNLSPTSVAQSDVQKAKQTAVDSTSTIAAAAPVAAAPDPAIVAPAQDVAAPVQPAVASAQVPVAALNVASQIGQIGSLFATPEQLQQMQGLMAMMQMLSSSNNANNGANNVKPGSPN